MLAHFSSSAGYCCAIDQKGTAQQRERKNLFIGIKMSRLDCTQICQNSIEK
jgi:hypothetical protein